jgi:hypothetical protein
VLDQVWTLEANEILKGNCPGMGVPVGVEGMGPRRDVAHSDGQRVLVIGDDHIESIEGLATENLGDERSASRGRGNDRGRWLLSGACAALGDVAAVGFVGSREKSTASALGSVISPPTPTSTGEGVRSLSPGGLSLITIRYNSVNGDRKSGGAVRTTWLYGQRVSWSESCGQKSAEIVGKCEIALPKPMHIPMEQVQ